MFTDLAVDEATLKGKRPNNQDKHFVGLNMDGKYKNIQPINCFGVFDGHNGTFISKFLHDHLPKIMFDNKTEYPLKTPFVIRLFNRIQNELRDKYSAHSTETGSTCLFVIHFIENSSNYINIINVGDSKCILCRNNMAIPLTKEHRPTSFEESARITKLGGKITESVGDDPRILGLSLSRSVGDLYAYPFVVPTPDLYKYKLTKDDKFFVLGCDGLYDYLSDTEIVTFILKSCYHPQTEKRVTTKVAHKLAQYAIEKGSTDNVSVVIVFLK